VAGVDFESPARLRCFSVKREVDAVDLATAFNAPSHRPLSPPIEALPSTPSCGIVHHHRHPPTPAEVDGNVDDPGSDGAIGNDSASDEDDTGEFVAVDLDLEADGMTNVTLSPGRRARDRSAVDNRRRESDVDEVPWQRQQDQPPPPSPRGPDVDALIDEYWQVEDVVMEERHHTTGGLVNASSYPVATRVDGYANLSLGYEYEEGFECECCTGREEGYYHFTDDKEMEEGTE
jgi:hypothetical protein